MTRKFLLLKKYIFKKETCFYLKLQFNNNKKGVKLVEVFEY